MKSEDIKISKSLPDILAEFITRIEFNFRVSPLEKIVYGMVSLILLTVLGGLLTLVILKR